MANKQIRQKLGIKTKIKKVLVPVLTAVLIATMLTGCSQAEKYVDGITVGQQIEVTAISTEVADQEDWKELGSLTSYPELREQMDEFYQNMLLEDGQKTGILYVKPDNSGTTTNNSCLLYAFQNNTFHDEYLQTPKIAEVTQLGVKNLNVDGKSGYQAAINSYYDLIKFNDNTYDGSKVVSRVEAMAAAYKAVNPRPMGGLPDSEAYRSLQATTTGTTERIASYMDDYVFLSTKDRSLNSTTAKEGITRGEAIYMIANMLYPDDMNADEIPPSSTLAGVPYDDIGVLTGLETVSESGKRTVSPEASLFTRSSELKYAMDTTVVPIEFYKAYAVADKNEWNDGNKMWDDVLSCDEFIDILLNALESYGCDHIGSEGRGAYIDEHGYTNKANGNAAEESGDGAFDGADEVETIYDQASEEEEYEAAVDDGINITAEDVINASKAAGTGEEASPDTGVSEEVKQEVDALSQRTESLDKTMYAVSAVNVRAGDNTKYEQVGSLSWAQEVKVTGRSTETGWFRITLADGSEGYVSNKYLSESKPQQQKKATQTEAQAAQSGQISQQAAPATTSGGGGKLRAPVQIPVSGNAADGAQYSGALAGVNLH